MYQAQRAKSTAVINKVTKQRGAIRAAATQQRQRPSQSFKGIHNFLDPMSPVPAPSVTSDGKALPHTGLVSHDFVVGAVNTTVLLVTNTGDSGTVGMVFNVNANGDYVDGIQILTVPTLAAADTAGGPSASRAMKFGVSVVNCSNSLKRGGRVTYLNSSQRLPAESSIAQFAPMITAIKSSPYRRRITGANLGLPTHLVGFPIDNAAYTTFSAHRGTLTNDQFRAYVFGAAAGATLETQRRPMSTVAFIFDPTSEAQDYSVTIRSSMYTRWPLTSVPGQSMRNMPTAAAKDINLVRDHAENTANDLAHLAEGGAAAMLGPRVAGVARSAAGGIMSRISNAASAADALAVDTLGVEGAALAEAGASLLV